MKRLKKTRRSRRQLAIATLAATGLLALPTGAHAATLAVTTTTDQFGSGLGCSLREAIQAANTTGSFDTCSFGSDDNLDTIQLANGQDHTRTLTGADNANSVGDLDVLNEPLNIELVGPGNNASISGNGTLSGDRVLDVSPSGTPTTLTVTNVDIRDGFTAGTADGGGIRVVGGTFNFSGGHIIGSYASQFGGGIASNANVNLTNATISGNVAELLGAGGVDSAGGAVALNSVTVSNNFGDEGGGLNRFAGTMTLFNTIVAGNTDTGGAATPDCTGQMGAGPASLGFNLIGSTMGCNYTPGSGDIVDVAANLGGLVPAANGSQVMPLNPGSPAIDTGATSGVPATDQRGIPRPQGSRCDMGAFEAEAAGDSPSCAGPAALTPATPIAPARPKARKKCKKRKKRGAGAAKKRCKKRKK